MSYKTELHCHTREISPCSNESGVDVAKKYIENGYTTLTVTNHADDGIFKYCIAGDSWEEKVDAYFDAIETVRRAAEGKLNVLDGMEINLPGKHNDYLVFGMTREMLKANGHIVTLQAEEFHGFCKENGLLFIQAHPMRSSAEIMPPDTVDGYEVFNGHPGHHSRNKKTEEWVKQYTDDYDLILTSGTDNHESYMVPDGGIVTEEPITDVDQLIRVLKSGDYTLIKTFLGEAEED